MNRQRPRLKNGVDLQLQSAFQDGNWPVVIRLAEKRAKTLNDQYYEAVKICAESQLDDPAAKFAAVAAVWKFVKDGTTIKDVDAIDLLEWATANLLDEDAFPETLGPLRVRAVKAAPKDKIAATRCLESCLLHWDLSSAQQIAAIIDRSFPQDRDLLFWNIVVTHLLSMSPQASPDKRKLYGTLAQKQIERAAQATEQAEASSNDASAKPPPRRVKTEEETLLLYDIVETHGTPQDFLKLISSPVFSPTAQFRQGRKEVSLRAIAKLRRDGDWLAVFNLCRECLSDCDDDGQLTLLASDIAVWRHIIDAAAHIKDANPESASVIQKLLANLLSSKHMRPMYRRNILLARVLAVFNLGHNDESDIVDGHPSSLRLRELVHYLDDQFTSPACFSDVKTLMESLDADGLKYLAFDHLPRLAEGDSKDFKVAATRLLALKTQYLLLTHRKTKSRDQRQQLRCTVCEATVKSTLCSACLSRLSEASVAFYDSVAKPNGENAKIKSEVLPELAILVAFCGLNLAFDDSTPTGQPLESSAARHLIRATLLLDDQLAQNPGHSQLSLVLSQLHIRLGSAYRASDIWDVIGVKRTIIDSLGPVFYDRLSTIAPALLSSYDSWGSHLMDLLQSHYQISLKLKMPRRLVDAFESGSYSSVMGVPKYIDRLRMSCTRAMSLVEARRIERLLGQTSHELESDPRFYEIDDEAHLIQTIDYGSFPTWNSSTIQPMHLNLRLGPAPSNRRCHLSMLAEAFHELLGYKSPASYKASAGSLEYDHIYVIETLARLSNSLSKFLAGPDDEMTRPELLYFEAISLICTLMSLCIEFDRSSESSEALSQIMNALKLILENQRRQIPHGGESSLDRTITMLSSMHDITMLRDTTAAIKMGTQWILNHNEREKARDRSGKSGLPKDLASQIKDLQTAAEASIKEGQGWISGLKSEVMSRDFEPKLKRWLLEDDHEIKGILSMDSLSGLIDSWQSNVKGWQQVKWA
ncbi:N-acetyltransferase B complex non catalytic subunit domain-containing protein [Trichoderma chlorosporum]